MTLFRKRRPQVWNEELFNQVARNGALHLRLFSMILSRSGYAGPARLVLDGWEVEGVITGWKHQPINCIIEIASRSPLDMMPDGYTGAIELDENRFGEGLAPESVAIRSWFNPDGQLEDAMRKSFAAVQPVYPARGVPFTINLDRAATWETISESRRCDIQSYRIHECWDGRHNPHLHARRAAHWSELLVSAGALYLTFRLADELNTTITKTIGLNLHWLVWFSLCVGVFSWLTWATNRVQRTG
jgi:hypothetical protein